MILSNMWDFQLKLVRQEKYEPYAEKLKKEKEKSSQKNQLWVNSGTNIRFGRYSKHTGKETINKTKEQPTEWERYLYILHLISG